MIQTYSISTMNIAPYTLLCSKIWEPGNKQKKKTLPPTNKISGLSVLQLGLLTKEWPTMNFFLLVRYVNHKAAYNSNVLLYSHGTLSLKEMAPILVTCTEVS